jgi:hypothetical protein
LAGLLIVVLALVPDRIRRKLELLYERFSSLKEKKIDAQIAQNKELMKTIDYEIEKLNILNSILEEPLYVTVRNNRLFSLNNYNIILLSYVVFIFGVSLINEVSIHDIRSV